MIKFNVALINENDYTFRKFHYVTISFKNLQKKIVNNCLNIDCSLFAINRFQFNKYFVVNFTIKQLFSFLSIRNIDNIIHHIIEYVVVSLYFDDHIIDQIDKKRSTTAKIQTKLYIVDDLKINVFFENDVFRVQRIIINLKK